MILGSAIEDADEGWSAVSVVNPVSDVEDKSLVDKGKRLIVGSDVEVDTVVKQSVVTVIGSFSGVDDKTHFVKGKHVSGLGVVDTDVEWTVTIVVGSLSDIVDEVCVLMKAKK